MSKEAHQLYCKAWRADNKARISEYNKKYWATHNEKRVIYKKDNVTLKEEKAAYNKEYYKNNRQVWKKHQASSVYKEYQRTYQAQRRRELKDRGSFTAGDVKDLYATQGGGCYYCSIDIEAGYHIEHMVPLSRGGRNDISNICLACAPCNVQKHTKTAKEFMNV